MGNALLRHAAYVEVCQPDTLLVGYESALCELVAHELNVQWLASFTPKRMVV